jgi:demethylmenaquinone methyltransferase/2-methoxy-6-polyprenyl-1,4-benzoquinol methylase
MFTSIAHAYDLNNRLHSFWRDQAWRRAAVRMAAPIQGARVLDCACGTGDLTEAFANAGAASVTGLDYTAAMLDLARAKATDGRRLAVQPTYVQGDAQSLPWPDASFDIVSIAFGIRNVDDTLKALREFHRVLAPGGRLVVLEFGEPGFAPLRWFNRLYTHHIMPLTASLIARDRSGAYRYLPRSVETYLSPERLRAQVEESGFVGIRQHHMTFGVCVGTLGTKR